MWQHHARVQYGTETSDTVTTGSVKTRMISSSQSPRPTQPAILSGTATEYEPTCSAAAE